MALKKPKPKAVQAKVTVTYKTKKVPNEIPLGESFVVPAGYSAVDLTNSTWAYNLFQLSNKVVLMELGSGAAPDNMINKCFYLHGSFEWKIIKHGSSMLLIPLLKK